MSTTLNKTDVRELQSITLKSYEHFLEGVQTDVEGVVYNTFRGICSNMENVLFYNFSAADSDTIANNAGKLATYTSHRIAAHLTVSWKHPLKQDSLILPIKATKTWKYGRKREGNWEGKQLKARISLLKHIIKHLDFETYTKKVLPLLEELEIQ